MCGRTLPTVTKEESMDREVLHWLEKIYTGIDYIVLFSLVTMLASMCQCVRGM